MGAGLVRVLTLGVFLAMAGCGGGAGDSSESAPQTDGADPEPAPATVGTRATCNLPDFEAEMPATVNAHRAVGASCGSEGSFPPASPLAWNALLTQASLVHSDDMVASNVFSHTGSDGSRAGQRATVAGYVWQSLAENIAVACVSGGAGNSYRSYWTMTLGLAR